MPLYNYEPYQVTDKVAEGIIEDAIRISTRDKVSAHAKEEIHLLNIQLLAHKFQQMKSEEIKERICWSIKNLMSQLRFVPNVAQADAIAKTLTGFPDDELTDEVTA